MSSDQITLAIESAVGGGSLAVFRGETPLANWIGTRKVSRSEDLLLEISNLIDSCSIDRNDIDLIAVANDCGSRTGLRIGISTALGLKMALNCRVAGVSLLKAMASRTFNKSNYICAAASSDRHIFFSIFKNGPDELPFQPRQVDIDQFLDEMRRSSIKHAVVNDLLSERIQDLDISVQNIGSNLAAIIGGTAISEPLSDNDLFQYI